VEARAVVEILHSILHPSKSISPSSGAKSGEEIVTFGATEANTMSLKQLKQLLRCRTLYTLFSKGETVHKRLCSALW